MALAFLAIIALRFIVGFHFFTEGVSKINDKDGWTAEYFLKGAKGPFAKHFHQMADDADGRKQLCIEKGRDDRGNDEHSINPELTLLIWKDFIDRATTYYGFGSPDLVKELSADLEELKSVDNPDPGKIANLESQIAALPDQPRDAKRALESHTIALEDWLNANRIEILAHYGTESRLAGFDRDGENRQNIATWVTSLREQVDTIRTDRAKQLNGWKYEVEEIWDSLESQINTIAVDSQKRKEGAIPLHRPHQRSNSKLAWINRIIPWFDTIVGILLMIGLFTRFASLAAGLFLLSVIMTQPFWIPGTDPTWPQAIEMLACLVLFAFCAGRFGGLDFFFAPSRRADHPTPSATA